MISASRKDRTYTRTFVFVKTVLISEVGNATKDSELECNKVTSLNKEQSTITEGALKKQHIEKFRLSN